MEHLAQVIRETEAQSPTSHLLDKAILLRMGDIADLVNTQKQIQRGIKKLGNKKHAQNEKENRIKLYKKN